MASRSIQPVAAAEKSILTPVLTLKGHEDTVPSISYFSDGKQMISGSHDKTTRRWDLQAGKEIEARDVSEQEVSAVAVSKDGRWVVTAGGDWDTDREGELKVCGVETQIVRTLQGHSGPINCIDISADSKLLASGSRDKTARIWNLETGKLVAGPFKSIDLLGAVRFSQDSKKLAVRSDVAKCLEVWDVQSQKLDVRLGKEAFMSAGGIYAPVFWTTEDKTIVAAFILSDDDDKETHTVSGDEGPKTIYEFDGSTLETVGVPFKGHNGIIYGLALSFDGTLLASASYDDTINLWAFESRQVLASFDAKNPLSLILSPDSRQLAYVNWHDHNIHICNIPSDILTNIWPAQQVHPNTSTHRNPRLADLLNSDATRRAVRHNPAARIISHAPRPPRRLPTTHQQQSAFIRYLHKLLPSSSRTIAVPPVRNDQPRDPLDFPATSALPPNHFPSAQALTQGHSHMHPRENPCPSTPPITLSSATASNAGLHHLFTWWPVRAGHTPPPIVNVPLAWGQSRYAAAGAPTRDEDLIRDEDVPPPPDPNSQPPSAGEHGSDRLCGCF